MQFTDNLKSLTVVSNATATTTEPSYSASYDDLRDNGEMIPGDGVGALTGAAAVSVVPALPSGFKVRKITEVRVFNRDTTAKTITVAKVNNGTSYTVAKATLGTLESMVYDGKTWSVYTAAGELKSSALGTATSSAGTKNGATVSAVETSNGVLHQTVLTCTATPISIADDPGVAQYGGVLVYTFPEGLIATLGAIVSGNLTLGATGTIIDAFTGVNALGTVVATTGATLVAGEATWLQQTANATAAAKVAAISALSIATQLTESGGRVFDGTATPAPVFLNFAIADDATHTAGTGTFTGTITLTWVHCGDK